MEPSALDDHRALSRPSGDLTWRADALRRQFLRVPPRWLRSLAACQRLSKRMVPESAGRRRARAAASLVAGRKAMAQEFSRRTSRRVSSNGTAVPRATPIARSPPAVRQYRPGGRWTSSSHAAVARRVRAPSRAQIRRLRRDGARSEWKGARLAALLDAAQPRPEARYVVFHCADPMADDGTDFYYESIDFDDAYHAQTILAYELNDAPLPVANGAPVRLRVERQLGYKHAKYVMRVELVASFAEIAGGQGGYWEDRGYQWFAGI
jgi:hypothetical protein